jgi:gamma-glutamylcyclotransferase (GGCT)/AIG2-like uncharacterized protein YtfP
VYNQDVGKGDRRTVPSTVVDRLFVYGTLRAGQTSRSLVEAYVKSAEPATARGSIYAFPSGHPGLVVDDAGVVQGELITLADLASALPLLDAYEGDDFARVLAEITTASGTTWAWLYALASPELARIGTRVDHGDWSRWCAELDQPPK